MIAGLLASIALSSMYWFVVRSWLFTWGATEPDLRRPMRGDSFVVSPRYLTTLAITIDAPPEDIWPWLLQMGYQRGGLYSYDWLDRLFGYLDRPSANSILAGHQHLEVGDEIPLGRGPGFPVKAIESRQALVLGGESAGFAWVWQFGLYPLDERRTRLVSRNRAYVSNTVGTWLLMRLVEPAAFIMTRKMLLGLKRRAEALSMAGRPRSAHAA